MKALKIKIGSKVKMNSAFLNTLDAVDCKSERRKVYTVTGITNFTDGTKAINMKTARTKTSANTSWVELA